jgi:hypothetical protein
MLLTYQGPNHDRAIGVSKVDIHENGAGGANVDVPQLVDRGRGPYLEVDHRRYREDEGMILEIIEIF